MFEKLVVAYLFGPPCIFWWKHTGTLIQSWRNKDSWNTGLYVPIKWWNKVPVDPFSGRFIPYLSFWYPSCDCVSGLSAFGLNAYSLVTIIIIA